MRIGTIALALLLISARVLPQQRFPSAGTLPDAESFFREVRENLARAERATHLFSYKERRTELHTNPFGRIGTGGTVLYEVHPALNRRLTCRKLLERDGKAVSNEELARQDREYRARVAEVEQRLARESDEERRRREHEEALAARARAEMRIDDIAEALQFRMVRRELRDGQPAIVVAFSPKPSVVPKTRQGRIAQGFSGTIWVHETHREVIRVEAKTIDDISFGMGFVAKLNEGATASLTRRPLAEDLWMPSELRFNGHGRAMLFRRVNINHRVEWFDYRKMDVDGTGHGLCP